VLRAWNVKKKFLSLKIVSYKIQKQQKVNA